MTRQTYKNKTTLLPKIIITLIVAVLIFCGGILAFSYSDANASLPVARADAAQDDSVNKYGFADGDGSEKNPFLIATAEQLSNVRKYSVAQDETQLPGNYFRVIADIDLTAYLAPSGGGYVKDGWGDKGWEPIDIFEGTFDGGGYTISGLWIGRSDENHVGLFGSATGSYIKNIRLVLSDKGITGLTKCGGIAGSIDSSFGNKQSAKISNCSVTGNVTAEFAHTPDKDYSPSGYAGLIAGWALHSEIEGCEGAGTVTGLVYLGGIAGGVEYANISNSIFRGEIISTAPDAWETICAGGIAGVCLGDSILKNCFYYGVSGLNARIAAIAGYNGWMNTYFSTPPQLPPRLRPYSPPEIYNCYYNADAVKSPVTYMEPEEAWSEDCGDETCDHTACDGSDYLKYAVIENSRGLTAAEMKDRANFESWDFDTTWGFDKDGNLVLRAFGNAYTPPSLAWLWITIACVLGAGVLLAVFVILYKRKKPVFVTETITVKETVEVLPSPVALPDTLTAREKEIAGLIVAGKSTKEMLDILFISPNTLKRHIRNLFEKTGALSQKDFILKHGLGINSVQQKPD